VPRSIDRRKDEYGKARVHVSLTPAWRKQAYALPVVYMSDICTRKCAGRNARFRLEAGSAAG